METIEILQLDKTDIEFVDILTKNGFTENEAKVLTSIKSLVSVTSKTIMQTTDLTQSAVSVAVNELMDDGYVKIEKGIKKEDSGKGRPSMIYSLNKSINDIIDDIEKQTIQQIDDINKSIQRLKELSYNIVSCEDTE